MKIRRKRPLAKKSRWRHILLTIKLRYLGNHASQIKNYFGSLSGSHARFWECVLNQHLKCPWAKKSWCRHIWLAIKPYYLRNHASQKKSCYGTLSGSYGRSSSIRHKKSREAPPGGQITMTSYPVCKKPRYLENHASQMKSYNGSLSWSLVRLVILIKNSKYFFKKLISL